MRNWRAVKTTKIQIQKFLNTQINVSYRLFQVVFVLLVTSVPRHPQDQFPVHLASTVHALDSTSPVTTVVRDTTAMKALPCLINTIARWDISVHRVLVRLFLVLLELFQIRPETRSRMIVKNVKVKIKVNSISILDKVVPQGAVLS